MKLSLYNIIQSVSNRTTKLYHLLFGMLIVCITVCYLKTDDSLMSMRYILIAQLLMIYCLIILFYSIFPRGTYILLIVSVVGICSSEICLGLFQLLGYRSSNHYLYAVTGSFKNPGPYGGFLAICISLLATYHIKYNNQKQKFISKLLYWGSSTIAIAAFIILPSTQSRSAILALGCGMILLVFGTERIRVKIKPFLKKYGLWLTLGLAIIGTSAYLFKKPSADGRLFMDKICIKAMCENGWKGAGIGHFGGAYGKAQASYFKKQIEENGKDDLDWRAINEHDRMTADCPDNAFNEYLFIGVEAGPITMLLFIGIIISAIIISFKRGTIWCYGMTAFAVFAMFSYPLHVKQFQILLPILLAACVSDRQRNAQKQNGDKEESFFKNKYNLVGIVTMVAILMTLSTIIILRLPEARLYKQAENDWKKAEYWHIMEYYEYVVEDCDKLMPYMNHDYRFLFAYGQSLNKTRNYEKSDSILKMGTEISSDPMFWNVMGNNSLALGKYREAEDRYKHAFYIVPNRLYPLYLLAKLYHEEGDITRFLEIAEKVETIIPKIESVNTDSLRMEIINIRNKYTLLFERNENNKL